MHATLPRAANPSAARCAAAEFTIHVDGEPCTVRAAHVCTIEEVLDFDQQFDEHMAGLTPQDAAAARLVADVLDSRMIAPPRPRRRRERPRSSRAMFYSSTQG